MYCTVQFLHIFLNSEYKSILIAAYVTKSDFAMIDNSYRIHEITMSLLFIIIFMNIYK
jgi:hypothetical protein